MQFKLEKRTCLYRNLSGERFLPNVQKGEVRDKQEAIQSAIYAKAFSNGTPFGENVVTEREMRE